MSSSSARGTPQRRFGTKGSWPTPSTHCSASRSTSASPSAVRAQRPGPRVPSAGARDRRQPQGTAPGRAEGPARAPDRRPRAGGDLQPRRPGGRRRRARPVRRLGRARHRGALARCSPLRVRRARPRRGPRDPAEPRAAAADRARSWSGGTRSPSCARRRRAGDATTSSSATRPTSAGRRSRRRSPRGCRAVLAPDGLLVVETDARTEPQLPLDPVTSRRYGSARITIFRHMP